MDQFFEIMFTVAVTVFFLLITAFIALCLYLMKVSKPYPNIIRSEEEKHFFDPIESKKHKFPLLQDRPSINLSVVIPAYDEEQRLPVMLDECILYLNERTDKDPSFVYEIIIVSDGSKDGTVRLAHEYSRRYGTNCIRVLDLKPNRGKGGAVRLGVQSTRGAVILFADADGATKFADLEKLELSLNQLTKDDYRKKFEKVSSVPAIICGSRAHLEQDAIASRSYFRTLLMHGFHFLVWFFAVKGVKDTQCGFKLLTRSAALLCFSSLHIERWAFDVELLYIAQRLKIPTAEVAVKWTEIDGSKIVPVWSWLQMGRDLFLIWLRYATGAWKIKPKED